VNALLRVILRLVTLVLAISVVVVVLSGSLWYVWRDAKGQAPQVGYTITTQKVETLALGLYLRYRGTDVTQPVDAENSRERAFIVESGESVTQVAYHLQRVGLVGDAELFRRVVQFLGAEGNIEAGVFSLRPNMTMEEIAGQLQHGRLPAVTVTIPEGWRAEQIGALCEEKGITSAQGFLQTVLQGRSEYDFLSERPPGSPVSVEGFLFPDTYQLPLNSRPGRVVDIMLQNWDRRVSPDLRDKAADEGLSLYEVITLASVVEREAVLAEERPIIASVYLNRLQVDMYLQADPTVQYAKGYDQEAEHWWSPAPSAILVWPRSKRWWNQHLPSISFSVIRAMVRTPLRLPMRSI